MQWLTKSEREQMAVALRANMEEGVALLQNKNDTSFVGYGDLEDGMVIMAIRSVPCHY